MWLPPVTWSPSPAQYPTLWRQNKDCEVVNSVTGFIIFKRKLVYPFLQYRVFLFSAPPTLFSLFRYMTWGWVEVILRQMEHFSHPRRRVGILVRSSRRTVSYLTSQCCCRRTTGTLCVLTSPHPQAAALMLAPQGRVKWSGTTSKFLTCGVCCKTTAMPHD